MRRAAALVLAAALLVACRPARQADGPPGGVAPVKPRGTVVLEPPHIEVGDTAELVLAVVTPPGWRAAPLPPLQPPEGMSILEVAPMRVEKDRRRWIHRAPVRVRALRTGTLTWPALTVDFTRPDGSDAAVRLPVRPVEVEALLPDSGPPKSFLSYRLPQIAEPRSVAWRIGLVVLAALVAVVLLTAARRLRRGRSAVPPPSPPSARGDWGELHASIETAEELAEDEPLRAADLLSAALRTYLARRYGASTRSAATEELAGARPPFALTTRWPRVVAFLSRLDDLRFTPPDPGADPRPIQRAIAEARSLAKELVPPGGAS